MSEKLDYLTEKQSEKQKEECTGKQGLVKVLLLQKELQKINWEDLSLTDKIFIGALLREGISENYDFIKPIVGFINPFAPTHEFSSEIFIRLSVIMAIMVDPDTDPESIEINEVHSGVYRSYGYRVKWKLNIICEELDKTELIEFITNPTDLDYSEYDDILVLWKKIALYESIEYFRYMINRYLSVDYKIGNKTKRVLNDLINHYSVAQIYGIIKKAVMKAVIVYARGVESRKHAVNSITDYVESIGEKEKTKKRALKKHNRVKVCPESALSKFFFDRVIKIGSEGFSEVPNIDKIKSNLSESA